MQDEKKTPRKQLGTLKTEDGDSNKLGTRYLPANWFEPIHFKHPSWQLVQPSCKWTCCTVCLQAVSRALYELHKVKGKQKQAPAAAGQLQAVVEVKLAEVEVVR